MNATFADVLSGSAPWSVEQGDLLEKLFGLPEDSIDLCLFSPPYETARSYGIGFKKRGQDWVDWMAQVFLACQRVCKGLVACVCEGQTKKFRYSAAPLLLAADLQRLGLNLRKPPIYHRVGIPGSGGPDWLRNDYELIICTTRPGKLPWSDNTACGHAPKWAPGGAMSNRLSDGQRVNQWGKCGTEAGVNGTAQRTRNGDRQKAARPSHVMTSKRRVTSGHKNGDTPNSDSYDPPAIANPGNVITCKVGGGQMGHELAHENEAPYPEQLTDFFVRSFCKPGGVACDPFCGSGTTGASAVRFRRRFIGFDIRQSQVELATRRIGETAPLFEELVK